MKLLKITLLAAFTLVAGMTNAQSVEEILDGYFENTGGRDAWNNLEGVIMEAKISQQGMEIPLTIVQLADGRTYTAFTLQGMTLKQNVFDGETLWSTNFQTMKPEKADSEQTANVKKDANDFPDPFLNYEEKGYKVELMGKETIDGAETFKVKLTKEPKIIEGEEVEDISFYYFDSEAYIPLVVESEVQSGPMAGKVQQITMSDYQEVEGLYFPFSMTQGVKDGPSQPITFDTILVNPDVNENEFEFPEN